ncbi:hypothetical protein FQA39_LY13936 [Lamprigera yunnana]|nr:hypothetical protein FQA39_LY13936 [Lamprigera yunnana]
MLATNVSNSSIIAKRKLFITSGTLLRIVSENIFDTPLALTFSLGVATETFQIHFNDICITLNENSNFSKNIKMTALKVQKELEMKVHENFHNCVHFLTLSYPPSENFALVFKKNMFVKTNKVGFQQVMYYLLDVLDKDLLKKKISSWPLYDVRSENEFRKEVMRYINELNIIYEDANIPNITTSHLITPGGFKFIKFMCKLSQFVLYRCIKKNPTIEPNILVPLKPNKNEVVTKENIDTLTKITNSINKSTELVKDDFEKLLGDVKLEAELLEHEVHIANDEVEELKEQLNILKGQFSEIDLVYDENEIDTAMINNLNTLKELKEKFNKTELLTSYLENPLKLKHDKEVDLLKDPMNRLRVEGGVLDLSSLVEGCIVFAERKRLEIKPVSKEDVKKEIEKFVSANIRIELMTEDVNSNYKDALQLCEKLKSESLRNRNRFQGFNGFSHSDSDLDTQLAVPLPDFELV